MSYPLILTNGTTLVDIPPSESNGANNLSIPIQISNVLIDPTNGGVSFVVQSDVAYRFVAGFTFSVGGGTAYTGTYTVAPAGAVYTTVNGEQVSVIPVVEGIQGDSFIISAVDIASNTFYIQGNTSCNFIPTTSVVIAGNANGATNGTYTILSSEVSGSYPISGVDDVTDTFRISGDHTKFFKAGMTFTVTGNTTTGNGTYTVSSSSFAAGETSIVVTSDIPATTNISGIIAPSPQLVAITTTAIPVGTTVSGTIDVSPITAVSLVNATAPQVTLLSAGIYSVTFFVDGDKTALFGQYVTTGCEILIKDNNVLKHSRVNVISATYNAGLNHTLLEVRYSANTTPAVTATGTAVIPALTLPYGSITFTSPVVSSPLLLVGKGALNYNATTSWGLAFQTNMIRMTEHFANGTAPVSPLVGQSWFDTTTPQFWLRDTSTTWKNFVVAGIPSAADVNMGNHLITNLADALADQDALNRRTGDARYVNVTGDTMTGTLTIDSTADLLLNTAANDLTMQGGTMTLNATSNIVLAGTGGIDFTGSGDLTLSTASNDLTLNGGTVTLNSTSSVVLAGSGGINFTGTGDLTLSTASNDLTLNGGDISLASDSSILFTGTGVINMNNNRITNLALPSASTDAANKSYVDSLSAGIIWIQPVRDANLFDDSLGVPPVVPAQYIDYDHTYLVKPVQYTIVGVATGTNGTLTISGNHAALFAASDTLKVINNTDGASNTTYTVVSATNNGANTDVVVTTVPATATVSGSVLHAAGAWNGKDGRVVYYNAATALWVDVLERVVASGDRFGVFIDPNNYDPLSSLPAGGLAGQSGKIAIITTVAADTYDITWSFYTPSEPDAVAVHGVNAVGFGSAYTFRGTWGTGTYGTDYTWIEFAGPTAIGDGAGLNYQGNILYVGQGTGITVNSNDIALNVTYTDGLYLRRNGTTAATADVPFGGFKLTNVGTPTAGTDATNKSYVDAKTISDFNLFTVGAPSASQVIERRLAVRSITFDLASSRATAEVAATASTVFSIKRNGTEFGTITFGIGATTGTFAVVSAPDQVHVAGDKFTIVAPATPDATLADLTITMFATLT